MFRIFLTVSLVLCVFVFAFELAADEVEYNEATTTVLDVFPKEIKIGDTLYCVIKVTNNTDEATHRLGVVDKGAYRGGLFSCIGLDEVKSFVFDGDKKWEIYPYIERFAAHVDFGESNNILVAPRSSALLFAYDVRVMSLEDLYEPFWLDVQKNL
ncbi:MAG: hypothetical protein LBL39_03650, partial [Planctomycetaceae bacterium]|nr:hypothetical protein [Planctomycetaceae bacterium]